MAVAIRYMNKPEFEIFYQWSITQQAAELVEEYAMSENEAIEKAEKEVASMLPDGLHTKHNHLMTIVEEDSGESAGFIWTIHEETNGRKQSFLCDFAIWEAKRRKGYASSALCLLEKAALEAGCQESVLFVADRNHAARVLYEKCGYQILRQAQYGNYMIKQL